MNRKILIENTLEKLQHLPVKKIEEIYDFAEFLLSKIEDKTLVEGIQNLTSESRSFDYLNKEEDLYSLNDLK